MPAAAQMLTQDAETLLHAPRLGDRFWAKVDRHGPIPVAAPELGSCWMWRASLNKGYGQYRHVGSMRMAYKVAYQEMLGLVPTGHELDHLCRMPACVNPFHLEPVAHRENVLRGQSFMADRAHQTHCARGHSFDEANTIRNKNGTRRCRICDCAARWRRENGGKA